MRVRYSVLSDASGSFGGLVASHNRAGQYLRTCVRPTNPASAAQVAVRTIFANLAVAWSRITEDQREAWRTYADNVPVAGVFGHTLRLTGHQMYVRCNAPRLQGFLARVDDGPTVFGMDSLSPVTVAAAATGNLLTMTFADTDAWVTEDDAALLVYGSRNVAPTIDFFAGAYRFASPIFGQVIDPQFSPVPVINPFRMSEGNRVYVRVRSVRADGRISPTQFLAPTSIGP